VPAAELALRQDLLDEEVDELRDAVRAADVVAIADALADIVYIACGTAQALGIPFDDVFAEVHRANMSKLGADGRPILRADGKILKGPAYTPPDVAAVLAAAAARAARPPNPEPGGG
jgi:predicted HAD superfamily Cof-like phosphohydrolase